MRSSYRLIAAAILLTPAVSVAGETVVPQSALVANGQYFTNNIGSPALVPNDDGSSNLIPLGFNFDFFGTTYNSLYINNNGNLTFNGPLSSYIPTGPTGVNQPVISAYFADVDTRGFRGGTVNAQLTTPGQLVVTWDNVGRYNTRTDLLNSFQIVLRSNTFAVPAGQGTIGFFYKKMPWEVTDTSLTAAIGFGNGAGDSIVLQGSNAPGLNSVVQDKSIWFNQNLTVVPGVPEPATWAMLIGGFGMVGGAMRRRQRAIVSFG